jgi:hypothetical protein
MNNPRLQGIECCTGLAIFLSSPGLHANQAWCQLGQQTFVARDEKFRGTTVKEQIVKPRHGADPLDALWF